MKDRDYRNTEQYKKWRKKVFERDDYTCQKCKNKGGNLEAHHIRAFKKYKNDRFVMTNGVTLCKKCHREVHKNKDINWLYDEDLVKEGG